MKRHENYAGTRFRTGGTGAVMLVVVLVLALGCLFAAGYGYIQARRSVSNLTDQLANQVPLVETRVIRADRPAIVKQVQGLSKLETSKYTLEKILDAERSRRFVPEFLAGEKLVFIAHGEVVGGVDLSKVTDEDITISENSLTMRLPEPEIMYSRIDNEKSRVYERDTGLFSDADKDLESEVRAEAEQLLRQEAIEGGILKESRENAEQGLRLLFNSMGYSEVTFR